MTYAPPPRFEIVRVVSRMSGVLSRNLPTFAVLALALSGLPTLVLGIAQLAATSAVESGLGVAAIASGGMMGGLLALLVSCLLQAALIHGTISDLSGRPVVLGDCLATAVRNVLPLIGIAICATLATAFGFMLLVAPGVILALAFCVSGPAQVVEGHGVFDALRRSRDLTRNHRGAILLLFVLYGVAWLMLQSVIGAFALTTALISPALAVGFGALVVAPILQTLGALIGAAGVASIYFELRTIKEGVGVEALAAAFD